MSEELVLVVDDDRTSVELCKRVLQRASYRVLTALSPIEGLGIIQERHIDLLLSDIYMPEIDGFELISQAKNIQPDLPVLIMTGYGSIDNAIQALDRGANGLIIKPFAKTIELVQAVKRVIAENRQNQDAQRMRALRPLFKVTEQLLAETSPQALESYILTTIRDMLRAPVSAVYYQTGSHPGLQPVTSVHCGDQAINAACIDEILFDLCCSDEPLISSLRELECAKSDPPNTMELDSIIAAPVQREHKFLFCAVRAANQPAFTEADLEMFVILARQAAIALENARLYSEMKQYVRQIEESQKALIQMEKMAAVGRLVASMAHEINNPLQAVRNCLHLAARSSVSSDQRFRYLKMMDIELDRLVQTVKQMLDFYRPGGDDKEVVDLYQVLSQVLDLLNSQFRDHKIQVHTAGNKKDGMVFVVPGQIQQVLFNLLINAVEAIQSQPIDPAGVLSKRGDIWIAIQQKDGKVYVTVEDSGPGIAEEVQDQVFEPFVSTKSNGTGLGLAVSYGIIERHTGSLSLCAPKNGTGACFEIQLPAETEGNYGKHISR